MTDKEKKEKVELQSVPTGSAIVYKLPDGSVVNTLEEYLVWMGNVLWDIKKSVA